MHKAADSTARHVWFSPSHNLLKWALVRNVPGAKNPQSADSKERSTSVNHMASVVSGAHLFPSQENKGAYAPTCLAVLRHSMELSRQHAALKSSPAIRPARR